MVITREVNGAIHEFELTDDERLNAYEEQQHEYDRTDVQDLFAFMEESDLIASYGKTMAEIETLFDDIAYEMRRNIDKYDMAWTAALDEAIGDILNQCSEGE
ncbi:MAG: hypothetical protein IJP78_06140 [Clostridia bacterium]|nr:hypothetical protein [Clostridia bacterium]